MEWTKVIEGEQEFYINEELGNIVKINDEAFVCLVPRVLKIGPFETLEEAQKKMESCRGDFDKLIEKYNLDLKKK